MGYIAALLWARKFNIVSIRRGIQKDDQHTYESIILSLANLIERLQPVE